MYVCMYVGVYLCRYVCRYVRMYVCTYVCTYVYMYVPGMYYVCMYACMYVPLVPPGKKKGRSSKIFANAAPLFSFSISLLRSFCGFQLFLDGEEDRFRIIRRCCCFSLTTAKWCRSCWWLFRAVGYVILSKLDIQVGRLLCTPIWAYIYFFQ